MNIRVFVDHDGITTFAPFDITEGAAPDLTAQVVFSMRPPGSVQDWHNAQTRMYVITLSGRMEVEIEGGQRLEFGPGDVRLAEDTTGPGHVSRVLGDEPWYFAVLMLP
jgi:quercetin dioxygenase-like cupin family protein